MKTFSFIVCLAAAWAAFAEPLPERVNGYARKNLNWRSIGPGGGGWIQSIQWGRFAPGRLLVGCDVGGFYLSENAGRSYEMRNRGLPNMFIETIAEHPRDPDVLFLGSRGGIFKSTDRGKTWSAPRTGLPPVSGSRHTVPISKFAFAPGNPDRIYAAVGQPRTREGRCGQLWRSDDGGDSWKMIVQNGLPADLSLFDLSVDPSCGEKLLASSDRGVWRSDDGGVNWSPSSGGLPLHLRTRRLARCAARPDVVYVTLRQKGGETPWSAGVWRSDDGGRTWTERSGNLRRVSGKPGCDDNLCTWTDCLAVDPEDPDTVWTAGASWWCTGVFKSTDGGATWRDTFPKKLRGWITFWGVSATCFALSPRDPRRLAFGTSGAVFVTEDGGATWAQRYSQDRADGALAGTGLEVTCLHTIVPSRHAKGKFYLGYFDIGLLVTEDGGRTMRRVMTGVPSAHINSCFALAEAPDDPAKVWAGFGSWGGNQPGIVARSDDGGRTWNACTNAVSGWRGSRPADIVVTGRAGHYRLLTAGRDGLMVSRDEGATWRLADAGFPEAARVRRIARTARVLYAAVDGTDETPSAVYAHAAAGGWKRLTPASMRIGAVQQLVAEGDRVLVTARGQWRANIRESRSGGAWLSTDAGATWKKVVSDRFCGAALLSRGAAFVALSDHPYHDRSVGGGVLFSRDDGATWAVLDGPGLHNWNPTALAVDPYNPRALWVGTGGNSIFATVLPDEE